LAEGQGARPRRRGAGSGEGGLTIATLAEAAVEILSAAEPEAKLRRSRETASAWRSGALAEVGATAPPCRPARPGRPTLLPPRDMPKRRAAGSHANRVALLHALAHIELNAVDLAWDIVARFANLSLPRAFYDDWVAVAAEEAEHHALVAERLGALGAAYGDLPAHDGLWEAAAATADDLLARLAVVPLVLEARGLDVTPSMITRLERLGDPASAAVLQRIYDDEIGHVATGRRWFGFLCARSGVEALATWRRLVARHFRGQLKPPFNHAARGAAGLDREFYDPDRDARALL
jgi:uncharacterized ferritin-like protein (DUF455 family)